jgi:prepilin-type N-terminal cleavage/methylation domain-containing protein
MNRGGYSLVEVMVAVAVVGIGMTAAAMLINTLMAQEEVNASSLRAANLQEQAVTLYRLGLSASNVRAVLPETCGTDTTPASGTFSLEFGTPAGTNIPLGGSLGTISMELTTCTMVFAVPLPGTNSPPLLTNTVNILRPTIR